MKRLFLSVLFVASVAASYAQDNAAPPAKYDIKEHTLFLPHVIQSKHFDYGVGMSFAKIPFDWVETAIQAPLFNFHVNYGLPKGFSLSGDFTTLIVSNQLRVGPRWNAELGNFSFNVGYDAAFMYGFLPWFGFDDNINALFSYPNISFGYNFGSMALSLEGEVFIINRMRTRSGEENIETGFKRGYIFTGVTVGLYLEQRLTTNHTLTVAFRNNYTKYFYPAWMAFPTFNRYYYLPELYLAFQL